MSAFKLNEKLKEKLVLNYSAKQAITTEFPHGCTLIPKRFFETVVYWDDDTSIEIIKKALKEIETNVPILSKHAHFDGPICQRESCKVTIAWALFDIIQ